MSKILIISPSVREGRASHRVALFFQQFIKKNKIGKPEIIDLKELDFPLFTERLSKMPSPPKELKTLSKKISDASGVLIISPEYNGGYPASLKNFIDVFYPEWYRKPVALAVVSSGPFGASQVIMQLVEVLWKMRVLMVPGKFHVANVMDSYDEKGNPADEETSNKMAETFMNELKWAMDLTSAPK